MWPFTGKVYLITDGRGIHTNVNFTIFKQRSFKVREVAFFAQAYNQMPIYIPKP